MTEGGAGRIRPALAALLLTGVGLAAPLWWVKRTVTAQVVSEQRQADQARQRWLAARAEAQALERRLGRLLAADRRQEAARRRAAEQAAALEQRIVATEAAINATVLQLDRLTGAPPTNLLPLTANPAAGSLVPVSLPALPSAPPPVHATTGASGAP